MNQSNLTRRTLLAAASVIPIAGFAAASEDNQSTHPKDTNMTSRTFTKTRTAMGPKGDIATWLVGHRQQSANSGHSTLWTGLPKAALPEGARPTRLGARRQTDGE
jgi:hypothetical protein